MLFLLVDILLKTVFLNTTLNFSINRKRNINVAKYLLLTPLYFLGQPQTLLVKMIKLEAFPQQLLTTL